MLPEMLKQIKQQTTETILSNERLTDNLKDDSANTLLNWGTTQIDTLLQQLQSKSLPNTEFQEQLDLSTRSLRRIMRQVNKLVANAPHLSKDELKENLSKLMTLSQELYPPELFSIEISPALTERAISRLASIAPHLDEEELVKQLLLFLNRFVPTTPLAEPEQTTQKKTPSPPPAPAFSSQANHFEEAVESIAESIEIELESDDSESESNDFDFDLF